MRLARLSISDKEEIKTLFCSVFTREPWNDDWSDEKQLDAYIVDLIGNPNSLTLGFYDEDRLVALSMGQVTHWYSATQYYINELCVETECQGKGIGSQFIAAIEAYLKQNDIKAIFLLTERDVPAFEFYKKQGFHHLEGNVAFAKQL